RPKPARARRVSAAMLALAGAAIRHGPMPARMARPAMTEPSEAELLEAARKGDRRAFGRLVRMHQRRVYACAVQMLGDGGDADDAVQETFVRAWRAIDRFDGRS